LTVAGGNAQSPPVKRVLAIAACAVGVLLILFVYIRSLDTEPDRINGDQLVSALAAYKREIQSRGEKPPESVTLDELIRRGFLQEEDVSAFAGMNAIISLNADETHPQSALMEVTHPDGTKLVVQGDGTVQQVSGVGKR
jgi:hypothetical protein